LATAMGGTARELLKSLFETGTVAGLSDAELLERFETSRDAGAQAAFMALVERHGPMVLRVCRDTLGNADDAEDAFQATFVVLSRRARAIRCRESIGPWIYGVALRVAACSRKARARRRDRERRVAEMVERNELDADRSDVAPVVHQEVGRLPEKYRAAVVLCYLEGLTHDQAASQLGWPVGTVRSRLAWAREKLRSRLVRRGVAPSAAIIGATAEGRAVVVPASLIEATVRAALGTSTAGAVPVAVAALTGEILRRSIMAKLGWMASGLVATGLVVAGGVGLVSAFEPRVNPQKGAQEKPAAPPSAVVEPEATVQVKELSPRPLRDPAVEPPRVLSARLQKARLRLAMVESLAKRAAVSSAEVELARSEVQILTAQLEAARDDLRDELELLQAQMRVRAAEVRLAKMSQLVPEQGEAGQISRALKGGRVLIKEAEVEEIQVRIEQVKRRLTDLESMLKSASTPIPGASPAPPGGN
jgi:RNA polymerase sigma factor (sigma-70 family)